MDSVEILANEVTFDADAKELTEMGQLVSRSNEKRILIVAFGEQSENEERSRQIGYRGDWAIPLVALAMAVKQVVTEDSWMRLVAIVATIFFSGAICLKIYHRWR